MRQVGGGVAAIVAVLALCVFLQVTGTEAFAAEPSVGNLFIEAFDKKDEKRMRELIKTRATEFPPEVKEMVGYAMSAEASPQEQDFLFNIAGTIATLYAEETKDERLLAAVRGSYEKLLETRKKQQPGGGAVSEEAIAKAKKELLEMGKGDWRITIFEMAPDGKLTVEIDVRESSGGEGTTPKISIATANKAKEEVAKHLPKIKGGSISWLSMGVALKTVFIE